MDVKSIIEEAQAVKSLPHMMFNASKLKLLNDYVDIAFENNEHFDNEIMLTLLRLFCLYPHCYDKMVVQKILICVLYNVNEVDINTYLSLINYNLYDDNIKSVVHLHDLVKKCQFKKLWNCIHNTNPDSDNNNYDYSFLKDNNNFMNNIRKYILNSISLSFENISMKKMSEYLSIDDFSLVENFITGNKWTIKKINYKGSEQLICCNGNIENIQHKKSINSYFNEDNISSYITKLNN